MEAFPSMAREAVPARHADGYRRLAQHVLLLAVHDRYRRGAEGESARAFFDDTDMLTFWCDVAGLDASRVA